MNQRAEAILLLPAACHELLDHLAVRELNVGPGRVDQQLLSRVAGELVLVAQEQLLVFVDGLESSTIGKLAPLLDVEPAEDFSARIVGQLDLTLAGLERPRHAI